MVMDMPVEELCKFVGHDGSQVVCPHLPDPAKRRGHHIQEIILACMRLGKSITPLEYQPVLENSDGTRQLARLNAPNVGYYWDLFSGYLDTSKGVLVGQASHQGQPLPYNHAMACFFGVMFDPDGGEPFKATRKNFEAMGFYPQCLWIVT